MLIRPISVDFNNRTSNLQNKNAAYPMKNLSCDSVSFTNKEMGISDKTKAIRSFIKTEIDPFLEEQKGFILKNNTIYMTADALSAQYNVLNVDLSNKYKHDFSLLDIPFVEENLGEPLAYRANSRERYYLKEKVNNEIYISDETKKFANDTAPEIYTNKFRDYHSAVWIYDKINKDIQNGFANTNTNAQDKIKAINEAGNLSLFNLITIANISLYKNNSEKISDKYADIYQTNLCTKLYNQIDTLRGEIAFHREKLPKLNQRTDEAQELLDNNRFTKEELNEAGNKVKLSYERTISRNVNKLKNYFEQNPELKYDSKTKAADEEFLKRQEYLNIKLWQRIEDDKKDFYNRLEPEQLNEQPMDNYIFDDLPF